MSTPSTTAATTRTTPSSSRGADTCAASSPPAAPTCESHVAIGGSLLVFTGDPGTLTNGTGIYEGATGRVISSKEVAGQDDASDIVARIHLHS